MARLYPILIAAGLGVALGLTFLPLPYGVLSPVVLAALLFHASTAESARAVAGRIFWATSAMTAVHLWWLTAFLGTIFHASALGVLALALFALEGGFFALMAYLVARIVPHRLGRVWGLAGAWVILEWLRFIGPFAFPWPTLGYSLLNTPMIQIADLGGVLLGSVLVTGTAAALVSFWLDRSAPLWVAAAVWVAALAYGVTRESGQGSSASALLLRTTVDVFGKAGRLLSPSEQVERYRTLTLNNARPGEVPVWPETAIQPPFDPKAASLLSLAPAGGLYGYAGTLENRVNQAVSWDGRSITAANDKARPVPFGEYFPLRTALPGVWEVIERATNMNLDSLPPARTVRPLPLNGVRYGVYICYDSVFPWVARQMTKQGANVLVNISNDGWYDGWGVQQHFMMGRVRAIENRRWVLRSVNEGIAAAIDDLGRPRQSLSRGEGVLHAQYKVLEGQTVFNRVGDFPALLLAGLMILGGMLSRRDRTTS